MNVLFLDSIEKETFGGMEEWIRLVAAGLVKRGHSVTVAGRPESVFLTRLNTARPGFSILPLEISGDFNPATIATLKRYLQDHDIDVIVVNFNKDVRLGGLAAKLQGDVRVVWSVGLDITRDSFIHRFLTPRLVDGVIVPSQSLKRQITRLGYIEEEIVEIIPIGIPDQLPQSRAESRVALRQTYGLPADAFVCVTAGRLVEQKGHRFLLDAVPEMIRLSSDMRFVWCGGGPLEAELKSRAQALGIADNVIFAGMLESMDAVLNGSNLMIHPSIEEPFGIAVLEGMRAGLPIVASNIGGIPEVLGTCGVLVEPRQPQAIADAVMRICSTPGVLAAMGTAARERFETHFDIYVMHERIERYLTDIVQAEPRRG